MHVQSCCFAFKPVALLTFSLPSPSSHVNVPIWFIVLENGNLVVWPIYTGKPMWFTIWVNPSVSKSQDWYISSRNGCLPFAKITSICQKQPRKADTGIKDGIKGMDNEFLFGALWKGTLDYLLRNSVSPGNFPLKRPENRFNLHSNRIFWKLFVSGKQLIFLSQLVILDYIRFSTYIVYSVLCNFGEQVEVFYTHY